MTLSHPRTGAAFPATAWTVIRGAQGPGDADRRQALDRLIRIYWRPVYWTLRSDWDASPEEAADLTQEYFSDFLEGALVEQVSPAGGRFRSWVKATLMNFMLNQRRAAATLKRGGGRRRLALEELQRAEAEPPDEGAGPERLFERELVRSIIRAALADLKADCERRGHPRRFALFLTFYTEEQAGKRPTYQSLQARFDLSLHEVKNQLAELRLRLRKKVLDSLRDGIESEADLVSEIREVFGA